MSTADETSTQQGSADPSGAQHTEVSPSAQESAAATPSPATNKADAKVTEACNKFLALLSDRIAKAEGLALLTLDFPTSKAASAESYRTRWRQDARRCFTVVARVKRRMRRLPTT